MPSTLIALAILVVAILPGAAYTWALERQVGGWGQNLVDRVLRFISVSLAFHLVLAWPEYLLYRWALMTPIRSGHLYVGQFAAVWAGIVLLVSIPAGLGSTLGGLYASRATRTGWPRLRGHLSAERETKLLQILLGRNPVPRAWDDFFSESPSAYLRVRTTDGTMLGGLFAADSYAAGFPQEPDLYLQEAWSIDSDTGQFLRPLGYSVYVPGSQIAWFEVVSPEEDSGNGQER